MYMIEITEDKIDNLLEHMGKGIKYFAKAMECLEEMKDGNSRERDDYDDEDYEDERYGNRSKKRYGGRGRYSRY